ncbi:hypothetical protein GCM10010469_22390 [Streptomyces labedae]|uniref:Integrase n=2 Tax=Streptomyces TaxID=1883 RepID=A0ABQ2TTT1_9ACTN|nr:hypothetical protein GCM10010265_14120 [Streptomyces griseoincarnatus]GGT37399.1 hypothetical protein GCM10010287_07250 [Streptomyces variabilis]
MSEWGELLLGESRPEVGGGWTDDGPVDQVGVDPAEVAARAGHSIAVLYRFYAKILKGGQQHSNNLISRALEEGDAP